MKLVGVVVWYNPTNKDIKNIETYIDDVEKLYIIDNTEGNNNKDKVPKSKKIEYIFQNENLGIAKALNIACQKAIKEKYSFILTMDQDSSFHNNDLEKMKTIASKMDLSKIGIISPWHKTKLKIEKPQEEIDYPLDVMTSGNILNLEIYKKLNGFKEFLFIDGVDIEYCLNLKKNGYQVMRMNTIEMKHGLGDIFYRNFFKKEFMCDNHNYLRIYYMARNYRYIRKEYRDVAPEFCDILVKIKGLIFKIIFYEEDKFKKLRSIFLGIRDYKKGKYGRYQN
ncbi:MAG: glycosyltransferase family 2 protein [bacterium]|nr:glycosyltransferase family 2 protein [bacterium]